MVVDICSIRAGLHNNLWFFILSCHTMALWFTTITFWPFLSFDVEEREFSFTYESGEFPPTKNLCEVYYEYSSKK